MVSTLELWEEDAPGFFKTLSRRHRHASRYSAVLIQKHHGEETVFVLHKSDHRRHAQGALEAIRGVVEPLVSDGSVLLTSELLKELVLPIPRNPAQLASDIVELMESKV